MAHDFLDLWSDSLHVRNRRQNGDVWLAVGDGFLDRRNDRHATRIGSSMSAEIEANDAGVLVDGGNGLKGVSLLDEFRDLDSEGAQTDLKNFCFRAHD